MTNNAKKANVFRVVTTVFGASSAFFLVSNMTWRELHKRHIDEITDGSSLKKAELSRTFIKSTGVATLVSFTGLTTVYAMHFIQAKKLVRTKEYRSVSATAGLGSLTISAKF